MIKIPYEIIEHRENVALSRDYSWPRAVTYWLYIKSTATISGIALAVAIYGLSPSWPRNIFFWKLQIAEAILWIPMIIGCALAEYVLVILRVHKKMNVVYKRKDRGYFRVETK